MTSKEKAKDLCNKFSCNYPIICKMNSRNMYLSEAKKCALIAVDEILIVIGSKIFSEYDYWQEVKQEIELL